MRATTTRAATTKYYNNNSNSSSDTIRKCLLSQDAYCPPPPPHSAPLASWAALSLSPLDSLFLAVSPSLALSLSIFLTQMNRLPFEVFETKPTTSNILRVCACVRVCVATNANGKLANEKKG